jgi:serine/threonine-protein kinase HipA
VSGWQKLGRALGMTARELESFAEAFEHPERDVARQTAR